MARIRSIKPEFWEDETVASLSRDARLLFIACFNMADDEGLLRWTSAYIKASAFMYDDDLDVTAVTQLMAELVDAGVIFPYVGGKARQQLAMIINFHRHQKVNRPQASKLPAPSLQSPEVAEMYARRDGWKCGLCGEPVLSTAPRNRHRELPSLDHVKPRSLGGLDYPSNIQLAHQGCNARKGARENGAALTESFTEPVTEQVHADGTDLGAELFSDPFTPGGEGKGREEEGRGSARERGAEPPPPPDDLGPPRPANGSASATAAPPRRCSKHEQIEDPPPCLACKEARLRRDDHDRAEKARPTPTAAAPSCPEHPQHSSRSCPACAAEAAPPPADWRKALRVVP